MAIQYDGGACMVFTVGPGHTICSPIDKLLRLESESPGEVDNGEILYNPDNNIKKIMSVCKCDELFHDVEYTEQFKRFISITGVSLTDHHTWSECFATIIVYYCKLRLSQVDRLFPDEPYKPYHYIECNELFSSILMLAHLGYPRALDVLDGQLVSIDFTVANLICFNYLPKCTQNDCIRYKSIIQLYRQQQRGRHTKSALRDTALLFG